MAQPAGALLEPFAQPEQAASGGGLRQGPQRVSQPRHGRGHHDQATLGVLDRGVEIAGDFQHLWQINAGQIARIAVLRAHRCSLMSISRPQHRGMPGAGTQRKRRTPGTCAEYRQIA